MVFTVCYLAKILHWKQFTTPVARGSRVPALFAISQRYYIESNSQRQWGAVLLSIYCLLSRKDTTLKAIHNDKSSTICSDATVCYLAKILHWKQFTTYLLSTYIPHLLFAISQRYYIESNSQPPCLPLLWHIQSELWLMLLFQVHRMELIS